LDINLCINVALDSSLLVQSLKLNTSLVLSLYTTVILLLDTLVTLPSCLAIPINFLSALYGITAS